MMRDQSLENLDFGSRAFVRKTHENDSMVYLSFLEDLFSEILIVGNEYRFFGHGFLNYLFVVYSSAILKYRYNFVTLATKPLCHCRTGTLIYNKPHLSVTNRKGQETATFK